MPKRERQSEPGVITQTRPKARLKKPPLYKVLLHNDETTTFEFVTGLLVSLFRKDEAEAERLTWEVHDQGAAVVEITSYERGELYVEQVRSLARPRGFPLCATLEPE